MSNPYKVVVSGPLAVYAEGFHAELRRVGYRPNGASGLLALMTHLSRWLDTHGAGVADLDPLLVERFLADRRAEGYVLWRSAKGLAPLLRYLRGIDVVPVAVVAGPVTAAEALIEEFTVYLRSERGLAEATIRSYTGVAGLFLAAGPFAQDMTVLTASDVTGFMLVENAGVERQVVW